MIKILFIVIILIQSVFAAGKNGKTKTTKIKSSNKITTQPQPDTSKNGYSQKSRKKSRSGNKKRRKENQSFNRLILNKKKNKNKSRASRKFALTNKINHKKLLKNFEEMECKKISLLNGQRAIDQKKVELEKILSENLSCTEFMQSNGVSEQFGNLNSDSKPVNLFNRCKCIKKSLKNDNSTRLNSKEINNIKKYFKHKETENTLFKNAHLFLNLKKSLSFLNSDGGVCNKIETIFSSLNKADNNGKKRCSNSAINTISKFTAKSIKHCSNSHKCTNSEVFKLLDTGIDKHIHKHENSTFIRNLKKNNHSLAQYNQLVINETKDIIAYLDKVNFKPDELISELARDVTNKGLLHKKLNKINEIYKYHPFFNGLIKKSKEGDLTHTYSFITQLFSNIKGSRFLNLAPKQDEKNPDLVKDFLFSSLDQHYVSCDKLLKNVENLCQEIDVPNYKKIDLFINLGNEEKLNLAINEYQKNFGSALGLQKFLCQSQVLTENEMSGDDSTVTDDYVSSAANEDYESLYNSMYVADLGVIDDSGEEDSIQNDQFKNFFIEIAKQAGDGEHTHNQVRSVSETISNYIRESNSNKPQRSTNERYKPTSQKTNSFKDQLAKLSNIPVDNKEDSIAPPSAEVGPKEKINNRKVSSSKNIEQVEKITGPQYENIDSETTTKNIRHSRNSIVQSKESINISNNIPTSKTQYKVPQVANQSGIESQIQSLKKDINVSSSQIKKAKLDMQKSEEQKKIESETVILQNKINDAQSELSNFKDQNVTNQEKPPQETPRQENNKQVHQKKKNGTIATTQSSKKGAYASNISTSNTSAASTSAQPNSITAKKDDIQSSKVISNNTNKIIQQRQMASFLKKVNDKKPHLSLKETVKGKSLDQEKLKSIFDNYEGPIPSKDGKEFYELKLNSKTNEIEYTIISLEEFNKKYPKSKTPLPKKKKVIKNAQEMVGPIFRHLDLTQAIEASKKVKTTD